MRFKTVAVITAQSILDAFIIRSHACSLQPLLRFHVVQFCSTGSLLTCVFHARRSAGLPYAKVTPWLWIGSTMFVLIGRLPPPPFFPPPGTLPAPSLPLRPAAWLHVRLTRARLSRPLFHCAHVHARVTIGFHTLRDPCTLPTI